MVKYDKCMFSVRGKRICAEVHLNEQIEKCTNEHINDRNVCVSCYSLFWVVKFNILYYDNEGFERLLFVQTR